MFLLNGTPLGIDSPFTYNDTQYPSNWLRLASQAERAAIGITEVEDEPRYDDRYYWGHGNPKLLNDREEVDQDGNPMYVKVLGVVDGKPAMVDSTERLVTKGLKSNHLAQTKTTANQLLSATDWMVIRKAERDVAIPASTVTYRAAVLTECDRLLAAIADASDVPTLMAVSASWPESN
jgi:hypothetical protein